MVEEEDVIESKQDDLIKLAEPGDLKLGTEILRLQTKIQELVKQEHLLETLISQAELTGNQAELRLLHRSQSSIRQETRSCIFQKAQYEQQEEENRLVPGRTRVTIPSHIDTLEEGKQVVRYIVRIEQLDENQEVGLKWDIARRYNDFHDLDKGVRDWASNASDKSVQSEVRKKVAELPSKKLVPVLSGNQLDTRRAGLERYLQVSTLYPFELTSSL
jgi:sorting nexin-25